jgi:ComF family protein
VYGLVQEYTQALLDLLYPPRCVSCQNPDAWLCRHCLNNILFIKAPFCERCGTSLATPLSSCGQCHKNPLKYIDGIRAASLFKNNPIRPAIHYLKYNTRKAVAAILGQILAEAYQRYDLSADVIVPVPLHPARLRERGYNQSELLARNVGRILSLPINTTTLQRVRQTKSQMELGAEERYRNVVGAFICRDNALAGQRVLLIDDVSTTGSTLDACADALKQGGVSSVWGLTLAKAR